MNPQQVATFWSKVAAGEGCWEWLGARGTHGYGVLTINGSAKRAHRVSWELFNGDIPAGLVVLHRCDNPPCVRPDHLSVGSQAQNLADMRSKGRAGGTAAERARKTHCLRGHEFNETNTAHNAGRRVCRACRRIYRTNQKEAS